jgi:hypothetical protein
MAFQAGEAAVTAPIVHQSEQNVPWNTDKEHLVTTANHEIARFTAIIRRPCRHHSAKPLSILISL